MRFMKLILFYGLSLIYFDLGALKKRRVGSVFSESIEHELSVERRKLKKKRRLYSNKKYKPKRRFKKLNLKLQGSHAKDIRYSNQKMLRRMYRNG